MSPDPKRLMRALALSSLLVLAASAAWAEDEEGGNPDWFPGAFSANVNMANDYPFRGISQTNNRAAIQGGIDWAYDIIEPVGIYAGGWASNVDFGDGDQAQTEFDIYGGVAGSVGMFSYDLMAIWYEYPGAKESLDYDFFEIGPTLGLDFGVASLSGTYLWSPDYFASSDDSHYVAGTVEVPVPESVLPAWLGLSFSSTLGAQYIQDEAAFGARDYVLFDVGGTISAFGLDVDLRFHDTDLNRSTCFGGTDLCDSRFVVGVSKSF